MSLSSAAPLRRVAGPCPGCGVVRGLGELLSDELGAGVGSGLGAAVWPWAGPATMAKMARTVQANFIAFLPASRLKTALADARVDIVSG